MTPLRWSSRVSKMGGPKNKSKGKIWNILRMKGDEIIVQEQDPCLVKEKSLTIYNPCTKNTSHINPLKEK